MKLEGVQNYLDEKLTKVLVEAVRRIVRERPNDPIDFLINYLIQVRTESSAHVSNVPPAAPINQPNQQSNQQTRMPHSSTVPPKLYPIPHQLPKPNP